MAARILVPVGVFAAAFLGAFFWNDQNVDKNLWYFAGGVLAAVIALGFATDGSLPIPGKGFMYGMALVGVILVAIGGIGIANRDDEDDEGDAGGTSRPN